MVLAMRDDDDPFDLERFRAGQTGTYASALAELQIGRKRGHWIWFVFPQLLGLGRSGTSRYYGIRSLAEARAYLADPVLGSRLRACARALVDGAGDRDAETVLGEIDARKVHSSMTLFHRADPDAPDVRAVLDRFYAGAPDAATDDLLGRTGP